MTLNKNTLAIIVVAVVAVALAIVVAALGWRGHKQKVDQQKLAALVAETTVELRQALGSPPSAESAAKLEGLLQGARAISGNPFADATETYILGAREIARRRADGDRLAREAAASRQALASHMAHAAGRGTGWLRDALSLKKKVESDHTDLARSLRTLDELLNSLGETMRRLAPYVPAASLLEDGVREGARARAQEEAKRAADELEKARRLTP